MPEYARQVRRGVTLLVTGDQADLTFTQEATAPTGVHPCPLDAGDLRTAATHASRLERDPHGNLPLPLLRVHAPSEVFVFDRSAAESVSGIRSIPFARVPRKLAGLIGDGVLAGVASGAVVSATGDAASLAKLRADIADHLSQAGFHVYLDIPGWTVTDAGVAEGSDGGSAKHSAA